MYHCYNPSGGGGGVSDDDGDAEGDNWPSGYTPHPCSCDGYSFGCGEVDAGYDFWTIKINSEDGEMEWDKRSPPNNSNGRKILKWEADYILKINSYLKGNINPRSTQKKLKT